jgi:hypothetical protein
LLAINDFDFLFKQPFETGFAAIFFVNKVDFQINWTSNPPLQRCCELIWRAIILAKAEK